MIKFTKKSVEVEAFQMTRSRRYNREEWPAWLSEGWEKPWQCPGSVGGLHNSGESADARIAIRTLESSDGTMGMHVVDWNDWIIRGVVGELYPCKPDIFEMTYSPANDELQSIAGNHHVDKYRKEVERLRALINSPLLHNFTEAVSREAAHQRERWGSYDADKEPQDWFWLVGYLSGKALRANIDGNVEKALHHTISTSAALLNWHASISDEIIEPEESK